MIEYTPTYFFTQALALLGPQGVGLVFLAIVFFTYLITDSVFLACSVLMIGGLLFGVYMPGSWKFAGYIVTAIAVAGLLYSLRRV